MSKRCTHAVTTLFLCFFILFSLLPCGTQPAAAESDPFPLIILDAGHGGEDGGAIGANGVYEKMLNLAVCRKLAARLRESGFRVLESRTEDVLLCDENAQKGHRKQSDLKNRLFLTQKYPDSVLISIHMNTFPSPDCEGLQVWYSPNNARSAELAMAIQLKVKERLQSQNNRKIKAATSGIYLLKHASVPAVLVECGFLSSPSECARLCDEAYQAKLAEVLFAAISENITLDTCEKSGSML